MRIPKSAFSDLNIKRGSFNNNTPLPYLNTPFFLKKTVFYYQKHKIVYGYL